jgi:ATP-dependent exoDNAse (exonuclease V) alpha subunit
MRTQLPLAPGFAVTCHSAQGATLDAAVVELNLPPGANPIAAYIAISRVRHREDVLIVSHFKPDVFRIGTPPDRAALLEHFRRLPDTYAP